MELAHSSKTVIIIIVARRHLSCYPKHRRDQCPSSILSSRIGTTATGFVDFVGSCLFPLRHPLNVGSPVHCGKPSCVPSRSPHRDPHTSPSPLCSPFPLTFVLRWPVRVKALPFDHNILALLLVRPFPFVLTRYVLLSLEHAKPRH